MTPPPGSRGDLWDGQVWLPGQERVAEESGIPAELFLEDEGELTEEERSRLRRQERRRKRQSVRFQEWAPKTHVLVIAAWVAGAMAALSTGPALVLLPFLAGLGILLSAGAATLLYTIHKDKASGHGQVWAAMALAVVLLAVDQQRPEGGLWRAMYIDSAAEPRFYTADGRTEATEERMVLLSRIVACASHRLGPEKVLAVGRDGANFAVNPRSEYFAVSTIAKPDPNAVDAGLGFSDYTQADLPLDPYADDPGATFGAYFTEKHLLIYSRGPDGDWDINPRRPVSEHSADPSADLAPFLAAGTPDTPGPEGDILMVFPRATLLEDADCGALREELRGEKGSWF